MCITLLRADFVGISAIEYTHGTILYSDIQALHYTSNILL